MFNTIKERIIDLIISYVKKRQKLSSLLGSLACRVCTDSIILLDYPVNSKQRWTYEHPHQSLYQIIKQNISTYEHHLKSFLPYIDYFINIPEQQSGNIDPFWINDWMPALDGVALYSFITINKPRYFIEIGSGNSTKFAHKAIIDHNLSTKIISIDPCPRAEVTNICDENIREPVENINLEIFDQLERNDILYIDNSHRVFMNSDVTAFFLDIIPILKPGVFVEIHDISLPYDYPTEDIPKYYSEQYLLAAYLLAQGKIFDIVLPCMFISYDQNLKNILSPLWEKEQMKNVETHGCSFWICMN